MTFTVSLSVVTLLKFVIVCLIVSGVIAYFAFDWLMGKLKPTKAKASPAVGDEQANGSQPNVELAAPEVPRLKLFLSWAAVQRAVRNGTVSEEDLDKCLFCTSIAELNLAEEYDRQWFEQLHPIFIKAAKDNRLICNNEREHYNATPIWMVNMLLKRNGYALLSCADQSGILEQIPMYSCVPRVSDDSLEVLWAAHPLRGNWRSCWGRSLEEIDAVFASMDEAAAEDFGRHANWMDELNKPIIDEARRKFEKPESQTGGETPHRFNNAFWSPGPDSTKEFGAFMGGEDQSPPEVEEEDPADFWKQGRPQDEE